jgi:peptide-methionine (R)-S-oxide reductase
MTTRRGFLLGTAGLAAGFGAVGAFGGLMGARAASDGTFEVMHTEEEWRRLLTDEQFAVLRKEDTEPPFTSALNEEKRKGTFNCAGCDLPLYSSEHKFDSGTGWPSFFTTIPGMVETKTDYHLIYPRTEYHCTRCGGHHGHVFDDGPKPTGLRYCNNGVALKFIPKSAKA